MHLVAVRRPKELCDTLTAHAQTVEEAAVTLEGLLRRQDTTQIYVRDLKRLQRRGEGLHADLVSGLRNRHVLPADREDLLAVSVGLRAGLRWLCAAVEHVTSLGLWAAPSAALELGGTVTRSAALLVPAIQSLQIQNGILDRCLELARLRKQTRECSLALKVGLMERRTSPTLLLKWDLVCRDLERAVTASENVGNVIKLAVLKTARWPPA